MSSKTEESAGGKALGARFTGKWKSNKVENFEAFLKAVGVPWAIRKMAKKMNPNMTINIEGDVITETTKTMKKQTTTMTAGADPIESEGPMGKIKSLVCKWIDRGYEVVIVPEKDNIPTSRRVELLEDGTMLFTVERQGLVMKRWWTKVE